MICKACGRDCAETYIVETNGERTEVNVCPDCYALLYPAQAKDSFRFLDGAEARQKKVCPACGMKFEEFENTGLLGCADCYKTFRAELLPTIRFIQWGIKHYGNLPNRIAETRYDMVRELVKEQNTLQTEITHALKAQDFDKVQRLKRRMSEIKKILSGEEG